MTIDKRQHQPWETILVAGKEPGSLVRVAREGRLSRHVQGSYVKVWLSLVDESVLALVDLAVAQRSNVTFVYPSPAGDLESARAWLRMHHSLDPEERFDWPQLLKTIGYGLMESNVPPRSS